MTRRQMLAFTAAVPGISPALRAQNGRFRTSLAEWSLHKSIRSQMMTNLEFPQIAKEQFGIGGIEFVNTLWEAPTQYYLGRLKANMKKFGVEGVLIMCDGEGNTGDPDEALATCRRWEAVGVDQLVFGIGPAGTGKTLTAGVLAGEIVCILSCSRASFSTRNGVACAPRSTSKRSYSVSSLCACALARSNSV